jgi:hypothetical protein
MKKLSSPFAILLFLFISFANNSFSQVVYAAPEDFKEIKKRTLLVQLLEENPTTIASLEKKVSKAKNEKDKAEAQEELDNAKQFITDYNKFIKDAVTKYWDLNAKVEYKTITEIKTLRETKSNKYTVLFYSESKSGNTDAYGVSYSPLSIPTLNYSRIEEGTVKIDYSFFMTGVTFKKMNYGDMILSLILMKNHIAEIEKSKKKKYTFLEFAKDEGKKNCSDIKDQTITINKDQVHDKTTEDELTKAFTKGKLEFKSATDVITAIESETDAIYGFAIPNTIVGTGISRITFYRCFINVKTGKIYSSKGTSLGEFNDTSFREKEIGTLGVCD